jgi:hypothetical protein
MKRIVKALSFYRSYRRDSNCGVITSLRGAILWSGR